MALTDDYVKINEYLVELVRLNADSLGAKPEHIYYGDRDKIGASPTITVFAARQDYDLAANMYRTDNNMLFYSIVYFGRVQEVEANIKQADQLTIELKNIFNKDPQWGGLVTNGYVRSIDPGYAVRGGVLLRATRLTLQGYNKTMLTGA